LDKLVILSTSEARTIWKFLPAEHMVHIALLIHDAHGQLFPDAKHKIGVRENVRLDLRSSLPGKALVYLRKSFVEHKLETLVYLRKP